MATAYTCDYCGKFFTSQAHLDHTFKRKGERSWGRVVIRYTSCSLGLTLDICPECSYRILGRDDDAC